MESLRRGARNLFRSPLRAGAIIILLTISTAMALVMIQIRGSIEARADEITETVGTAIQVRPVGAAQGVGQPLTSGEIDQLNALEHVVSVDQFLEARYTGAALESAIDTSTFGDHGGQPDFLGGGGAPRTIPVSFSGVSTGNRLSFFTDGTATLTTGREFTAEEEAAPIALVGDALAVRNGLAVGSSIQLENGSEFEVIGIFALGDQFGENVVYMPLGTLQALMEAPGRISSATVLVDAVEDLGIVVPAIENALGPDRVEVSSELDRIELLSEPLWLWSALER